MAVATDDPIARMRAFVVEKPEQLKAQLNEWTAKQPAWVEGLVCGVTGSFQVRWCRGCVGTAGVPQGACCAAVCCPGCAAGTRLLRMPRVAAPPDVSPPAPVGTLLLTDCSCLHCCLQGAFLGVVMGSVGKMNVDAAAQGALAGGGVAAGSAAGASRALPAVRQACHRLLMLMLMLLRVMEMQARPASCTLLTHAYVR